MEHVIKIDFDTVMCDNFLGLNAVYHPFAVDERLKAYGETAEDFERELERVKEANLKIARPYSDLSDNFQIPTLEKWCGALKKIGVDVAIQPSWGMRNSFKDGYSDQKLDEYAQRVCKNLSYLINDCGLDNIKYMVLYTEATTVDDYPRPEGFTVWEYYVKVVRVLDEKLTASGIRDKIKLVGPNNSERGRHLEDAVNELNDVLDIYSGHFYNYVHQWEWKRMCEDFQDIVKSSGKPFWLDEYGMQLEIFRETPQYGTQLALIAAASVAAGNQTSLLWTLFDQKFPNSDSNNIDSFHDGVHRWGLYHWEHDAIEDAGKPYPAWYAYCLMANALGGEKVSSVKSGEHFSTWQEAAKYVVHACAVKSESGYTIVVINQNACEEKVRIETGAKDADLYRYSFEPWCNDGFYGTKKTPERIKLKNGVINDILPRGGFCVYRTDELHKKYK